MAFGKTLGDAFLKIRPQVDSRQFGVELTKDTSAPAAEAGKAAAAAFEKKMTPGLKAARAELNKTTQTVRELKEQFHETANADLLPQIKKAEAEAKRLRAQYKFLKQDIDDLGDEGSKAGKKLKDGLEKSTADMGSGKSSLTGVFSKLGPALASGALAAGAVAGAALIKGVTGALEKETEVARLTAALGADPEESRRLGALAGKLYAGAYGASMGEVTDAIEAVRGSVSGLSTDKLLEGATVDAMNYATTFRVDVARAAEVAGIAIKSGLAKDSTEAFDLMTAAAQDVPAALREDILDAAEEYSGFFHELGFSGPAAFDLLTRGAAKGQYGIDKAGDAIKEFTIRATDGSKLTGNAYKTIGLDAEDMSNAILAGGGKANKAFNLIVQGVSKIKDPTTRANTAIALFGTPLEDLSVQQIPDFLREMSNLGDGMGDVGGRAAEMGKTLNDTDQVRIESFKRGVVSKMTEAGGAILGFFHDVERDPSTKNFLGETQKFVSEKVLPTLRRFGDWFGDKILPLLKQFGTGLKEQALENLEKLQKTFKDNEPELRRLWEGFKEFADIMATRVAPAVIKFYFNALKPTIGFITDVAVPTIGFMIGAIVKMTETILTVISTLITGVEKMAGVMRKIPGPIGALWQKIYDQAQVAEKGVDEVRDALNKVPKNTTVVVAADTSKATSPVRKLQDQLLALVNRKYEAVLSGRLDYFGNPIKSNHEGGLIDGPLNSPGLRDDQLATVKTGEWVTPVDKVRKYMPVLKAMQRGQLPAYAGGGLVGQPYRVNVSANVSQLEQLTLGAARSGKTAAANAATGGGSPSLGSGGGSSVGAIMALARGFYPGARLSSGARNTNDYHGQGLAADIIGGGAAGMRRIAAGFYSISNRLLEEIHSGGGGFFVKNGRRVGRNYYASEIPAHYNHVHIAKRFNADSGADLKPGWNPPLFNGTGGTEYLRPVQPGAGAVTVLPGAIQITVGAGADQAMVESTVTTAFDRLLEKIERGRRR